MAPKITAYFCEGCRQNFSGLPKLPPACPSCRLDWARDPPGRWPFLLVAKFDYAFLKATGIGTG